MFFQKVTFNPAMSLSPSSYLFLLFPLEHIELQLPTAVGLADWLISCCSCSLNRHAGFAVCCFHLLLLDFLPLSSSFSG